MNSIRTIGATHRYRSKGEEYTFQEQFLDSVNIESNRLDTLILCPVGLRFHALHHLFPGLPYHALSEVHSRLSNYLPQVSDYHKATLFSVWQGWQELRTRQKIPLKKKQLFVPRLAIFALVLIGLSGFLIAFVGKSQKTISEPPKLRITESLGKIYRVHENKRTLVTSNMSIAIGDIIETDNQSFVKIKTAVDSEIILNQNSKLVWNQDNLHLKEGRLFAKINKKDIPSVYHLTAPDNSSITITGTAFEWSYLPKDQNAELKVKEGVVAFCRNDAKKVVVQNQALSASNFLAGPEFINGDSIATWVDALEKYKTVFVDSFNESKFNGFWKMVSSQKENESSPKNGLVCFGKNHKVELSSREIVLNHKGRLHIQFSSGLIEGKNDFEYGYEIWDGKSLILKKGIEASQTGVNNYCLKEIDNLGLTKELTKTKGPHDLFPEISFHLKIDPTDEHFNNSIKNKPESTITEMVVGTNFKKLRIVFYLKTTQEQSHINLQMKNFTIKLEEKWQ